MDRRVGVDDHLEHHEKELTLEELDDSGDNEAGLDLGNDSRPFMSITCLQRATRRFATGTEDYAINGIRAILRHAWID